MSISVNNLGGDMFDVLYSCSTVARQRLYLIRLCVPYSPGECESEIQLSCKILKASLQPFFRPAGPLLAHTVLLDNLNDALSAGNGAENFPGSIATCLQSLAGEAS